MEEDMQLGKTRWRRFAAPMALSTAAIAGMGMMVTNGVLAASFAVSGSNFKVSADSLNGTGFEQIGYVDHDVTFNPASGTTAGLHPVALSAIGTADLTNMCQSVVQPVTIPGVGTLGVATLRITAAAPHATNLTVDADDLKGDATFTNIKIGQDASTLDTVSGIQGPAGAFGQEADGVVINNLQQTAWATTAGTFQLSGLHLQVHLGNGADSTHECF
jgi:hypothetical protein